MVWFLRVQQSTFPGAAGAGLRSDEATGPAAAGIRTLRGAGRGLPGASPFAEVAGEARHGGGSGAFLAAAADGSGEEGAVLPACFFPQETERVGRIRTLASIGQKDVLKKSSSKTKWYLRVHRRRTDGRGVPSPARSAGLLRGPAA